MTLLHIDTSILGPNSVSRSLSAAIVERLTAGSADATVIYRDLAAEPLLHLTGEHLAAARGIQPSPATAADLQYGETVLQEFLDASIVLIGVGFYNFGIPSQLKAWIDRILIAGRTFRYSADGRPEGLAGGKRVILAIARGGFYGPGTPAAPFEHAESHLRAALGFIGLFDIEVIAAEGIAVGPEQRDASIAAARDQIGSLPVG